MMIMGRGKTIATLGAGGAAILLLAAAALPAALAPTSPGLWELSGLPNTSAPVRQCIADATALAVLEHRGQRCKQVVLSDNPPTTVVDYTCANGGFGHSKLTLLTPRSLRIETQGISANYPFNYVIQARRVGECAAH
jgi:hypothetical protein